MVHIKGAAAAATTDKRQGNPVTLLPRNNIAAAGCYLTGDFMPRDMRQFDRGIVSYPAMPVAAADAGRHDPQYDVIGTRLWIRHTANLRWRCKLIKKDGTHELFSRFGLHQSGQVAPGHAPGIPRP